MGSTRIGWATHTANWLAGCTKVSPACQHCYAETMTARLATMPHAPARYRGGPRVYSLDGDSDPTPAPVVEGRRWTGRVVYDPAALAAAFEELRRARTARRAFVNSMSDTFHPSASPESLVDLKAAIYGIADHCADGRDWPHVIMLLTKRPERMLAWQRKHFPGGLPSWVWVGCTVEDQQRANERVPVLLRVRTAGVRFVSAEPLLGPVTLSPDWLPRPCEDCGPSGYVRRRSDGLLMLCPVCHGGSAPDIGWVIAGGESGRDARPTHPEWARRLRDQCVSAGVPFFWKQWGEWVPVTDPKVGDRWVSANGRDMGPWVEDDGDWYPGAAVMRRVVKHHAGRLLDGREWSEVPRG